MTEDDSLLKPLSEDEWQSLQALLDAYSGEGGVNSLPMLDGYVTALVVTPSVEVSEDWFEAIWGGQMPDWPDDEAYGQAVSLVFRLQHSTAGSLAEDPLGYRPRLDTVRDGEGATSVDAQAWCQGFLRGMTVEQDHWTPVMQDIAEPLSAILVLAGGRDTDGLPAAAAEGIHDALVASLPVTVRRIDAISQEFMNPLPAALTEPYQRAGPKIGRNDPCPCGSWRKYKKCCLRASHVGDGPPVQSPGGHESPATETAASRENAFPGHGGANVGRSVSDQDVGNAEAQDMPPVEVDFEQLVGHADLSGGALDLLEVLVYRPTGAIYMQGDGIDPEAEEYPEDPETSDQYLVLPTKQQFGLGKPLAMRYARDRLSLEDYDRVADFFSRRGAYRRFKDFLDQRGLLDDWDAYEEAAIREEVRAWCEANGLVPKS